MVDFIDIRKLNLEELSGVISLYPWYGGARREMCERLLKMGACSDSELSQAALYMGNRSILHSLVREGRTVDCSDDRVDALVRDYMEKPAEQAPAPETVQEQKPKVILAGGDYFSLSQYAGAKKENDGIFSSFAAKAGDSEYCEQEQYVADDFCTETIAKIYAEQEYFDEAINIYSKLSLRYPEKSVYFAALIDEININR